MRTIVISLLVFGLAAFSFLPLHLAKYLEPLFYLSYLGALLKKGSSSLLNLGFFLALGQLVVSLSNAQLLGFIEEGQSGGMYDYIVPVWSTEALKIRFIGTCSFFLGYELLNARINWIVYKVSDESLSKLFFISLLLMFNRFFFHLSIPGTFGAVLNFVPLASILYFSRLSYIHNDLKIRIYAIILLLLTVLFSFLYATLRMEMILPIMAYFLGAFFAKPDFRHFLTPQFVPFYLGGAVFLLFFMAFGAIRGNTYGAERFTAITQAQKEIVETEVEEERGAFQRAADLAQITNVVDLVKGNEHTKGETITVLGISLVPRILWPDKPKIALGVWYAIKIGKAWPTEDGWYNTSINMTVPGHLYLELSFVGLIIGMLMIGMFYKLMWEACSRMHTEQNYLGTLFGAYLLLTVLFFGIGADLQIMVTLLATFLILVFVSLINRFLTQ